MSDALVDGVQASIALDPRIATPANPHVWIRKGGNTISYYNHVATSFNDGSVIWSVNASSKDNYQDKLFWMDFDTIHDITFERLANAGGASRVLAPVPYSASDPKYTSEFGAMVEANGEGILQAGTLALAAFPLQSRCVSSSSLVLNQQSFQMNSYDIIDALTRYGYDDEADIDRWLSTGPTKRDAYSEYSQWTKYGNQVNPLGAYGNDSTVDRGATLIAILSNPAVGANAGDQATVRIRVKHSEPLLMSPLAVSRFREQGFVGLQNININLSITELSRMLSFDARSTDFTIASISSRFNQDTSGPVFRLLSITPPLLSKTTLANVYPYKYAERFIAPPQSIARGLTSTMRSNAIQLNAVPDRVYIYARPRYSSAVQRVLNPNYYGYINRVSINFNNVGGILSGADGRTLFDISSANGYADSYPCWRWFNGSVLCVDMARDCSTGELVCPSLQGQFSLQVEVDVQNILPPLDAEGDHPAVNTPVEFELVLCTITAGQVRITGTEVSRTVGNVFVNNLIANMDNLDVVASSGAMDFYGGAKSDYLGAGWLDKLKSVGRWIGKAATKAVPYVERALPYVAKYGPLLAGLGKNEGGTYMGNGLDVGGQNSGLGGRKMSRASLASRM